MLTGELTEVVILTVNPGSTSTKVTMFEGLTEVDSYEVSKPHKSGLEGDAFDHEVADYVQGVQKFLSSHPTLTVSAIVGRGGFINRDNGPVAGGVYQVSQVVDGKVEVCSDIVRGVTESPELDHASNLGIPIAAQLSVELGVPAFCVDPVVSDDFPSEARLSGYASVERRSTAHALSVKMLGRLTAEKLGLSVDETRMVVAHLGGGITVAALRFGKMVDNNIALLGGGPFTPQRVGTMPMSALMDLCYSGAFTKKELQVELTKKGGLSSYLGEHDVRSIETRIAGGDSHAKDVIDAMAYQISKEIGAMAIAAGNPLNAIVFSGGMARSKILMPLIQKRIGHLAQVITFPGSVEMLAMARGALAVLSGEETAQFYRLSRKRTL